MSDIKLRENCPFCGNKLENKDCDSCEKMATWVLIEQLKGINKHLQLITQILEERLG